MKITDKQKKLLKNILNENDYVSLINCENDVSQFERFLGLLIDGQIDNNDELSTEGKLLDDLYYEIYNQN